MAIAFVIFVVYRKFNVIPPITITAFAEKFPDSSSNYGLEVFSEDLDIHYPVQIIDAPSEFAEFCVLTRTGEFSIIRKVGDSFEHKVVIDLIGTIGDAPYNELGAAGATFGPKVFEKDGNEYVHLFLYYAFNDNGTIRNRLVSYEMSLKDYTIDESSEKTLIDLIDPDASHNGGAILFGPDSYLYLGIGDAGPENDGSNVSQKIDESLYSGIHRIDVYGDDLTKVKPIGKQPANGKTQGYWIHLDKPFVGKDGVLEEFWALGIRNPLRFSFLPDGKRLIVGDVGQTAYEEVNIISAGDNGQWSYREGPLPLKTTWLGGKKPDNFLGNEVEPYFWYRNSFESGCSIGGTFYKNGKLSELNGKYLFADYNSGEIFSLYIGSKNRKQSANILISQKSAGIKTTIGVTSLYQYGDEILVVRLGPGKGGQSIFKIKRAEEFDPSKTPIKIEMSANEKFQLYCSRCHGIKGSPGDIVLASGMVAPRDFTDKKWQSEVSDAQIIKTIQEEVTTPEGVIVMPPWGNVLKSKDIDDMVTVIRGFDPDK